MCAAVGKQVRINAHTNSCLPCASCWEPQTPVQLALKAGKPSLLQELARAGAKFDTRYGVEQLSLLHQVPLALPRCVASTPIQALHLDMQEAVSAAAVEAWWAPLPPATVRALKPTVAKESLAVQYVAAQLCVLAKTLLDCGADVNQTDKFGRSVLVGVLLPNEDVLAEALEIAHARLAGVVKVSAITRRGIAVALAAVFRLFVHWGAGVNALDDEYLTPLHLALLDSPASVSVQHLECAKAAGWDPTLKDERVDERESAVELAAAVLPVDSPVLAYMQATTWSAAQPDGETSPRVTEGSGSEEVDSGDDDGFAGQLSPPSGKPSRGGLATPYRTPQRAGPRTPLIRGSGLKSSDETTDNGNGTVEDSTTSTDNAATMLANGACLEWCAQPPGTDLEQSREQDLFQGGRLMVPSTSDVSGYTFVAASNDPQAPAFPDDAPLSCLWHGLVWVQAQSNPVRMVCATHHLELRFHHVCHHCSCFSS